jgi:hypothetical protein
MTQISYWSVALFGRSSDRDTRTAQITYLEQTNKTLVEGPRESPFG